MREVQIKEIVRKFVRESFKQSISEASYDLGNKQYTDKNMTPTDILDLAMAYSQTSGNKMYGNKMPKMINVANDLARLNGTTQLDAKTRGKKPALILVLLKNKLVSKEEYINLYKELIEKQISVVKALKNADPASRMVGGAAARQAHKDMKGEFEESVNEMSQNDVHFKEILRMYDHGGSFTKKKVAVVICKNPKASRKNIIDAMLDMDYNEITDMQDELGIKESVEGDKIQNLNNRIKALRDKISATKSPERKSKFQNTLKNALQSISNIRKAQTESVNEAKDETYFKSATDAVEYARTQAEKKGFEIDSQDWNSEITMGGRYSRTRPGVGKTNSFSVGLLKGGKPQRKNLNISLYGMESGKFELTYYIN
jgi:hypothetical protein